MEENRRKATLEKLTNSLEETFVDDIRAADEQGLRNKIVALSKDIEDLEETKKTDSKLNTLKDAIKDINGAYKDAKKEKSNRLKYVILTMEERGNL